MTIEQRIERLEHHNRLLKWALMGIVAITAVSCAAGPAFTEDNAAAKHVPAASTVIQAGRFEVIDANGKVIAALGATKEAGGVIYTNNERGALVAQMGAADNGRGVVWTYDRDGLLRDSYR